MDVFEGTGQKEGNFSGPLLQIYSEEQQHQSEGLSSGHQDGQIGGGTDQHDGSIVKTTVSLQEASSSFRRKVAGRSADGKDQEGVDAASLKKRYWLSTKDEGILDRFNRLDWEVRELEKEIQENENQEDLVDLDGVHIADKVKQLTSRLSHLNKRALETPLEKIGLASDNLTLLQNDLKRVKAGSSSAGKGGLATVEHETPNTQNKVVYELALDSRVLSSASSSVSDEKTFQLEQRITNLERVIGIHSLDPASSVIGQESTSLFATSGTLIGALERIDHHLSMLADPLVFDQTMRRVKEATAALDKLAELKRKHKLDQRMGASAGKAEGQFELGSGIAAATPTDTKITYLYNQMMKLDAVGNIIPHLISRLLSLKSLHAEAATFSETLAVLKEDQKSLLELGLDTQKGMQVLTRTMIENQEKAIANLNALKLSN